MSEYVFNPRDSFLARCWWQADGRRIEVDTWDAIKGSLSAIWMQTGTRNARDLRDRYLQCEPDGQWRKNIDSSDFLTPEHRIYEEFWFGAYTLGSDSVDKPRHYQIRTVDRTGSIGNQVLDYNTFYDSGFVGFWQANEAAGALRLPGNSRLWSVDGLPRQGLRENQRRFNLRLLGVGGEEVRCHLLEGDRLFNVLHGDKGLITMEVLRIPYHFEEI